MQRVVWPQIRISSLKLLNYRHHFFSILIMLSEFLHSQILGAHIILIDMVVIDETIEIRQKVMETQGKSITIEGIF